MRCVLLWALSVFVLTGCGGMVAKVPERDTAVRHEKSAEPRMLRGTLAGLTANAKVSVFDRQGVRRSVFSDGRGRYIVPVSGLEAPLLVAATIGGKLFAAVVPELSEASLVTANVNALTDKIASDTALEFRYAGPEEMVRAARAPAVSVESVRIKTDSVRALILPALKAVGLRDAEMFDPLTADMGGDATRLNEVLALIEHHRTASPAGGGRGTTILMDPEFRELTRLTPLDLARATKERAAITAFGTTRIFVAGDATASYYGPHLAPRMGWGQALARKLKEGAGVRVINLAQPGRSARSFVSEGWLDVIGRNIREGDYLFIQFGLSDQRCGNGLALSRRDVSDIANLCAYPGFDPRIPPERSFANTLTRYVRLARENGAIPVMLTPVTRINLDPRNSVKGIFPIRKSTHIVQGGSFPGDYSRTVRSVASSSKVPLIDLDARSIDAFNKVGDPGWKEYYLAVDPEKYPYYSEGAVGNLLMPDNSVFQERGALAVADMLIEGMRVNRLTVESAFQ